MRKILFIQIISLFVVNSLMSQIYMKSSNQEFVEKAIMNGFFLIQQSYQLKDSVTNKFYGRLGKDEFGTVYSLGIKMKRGILVADQAIRPWEYDENFDRFRSTHIPVIYETKYKELCDSCTFSPFEINRQEVSLPGQFSLVQDSHFHGNGFELDTISDEKDGWLVWIVSGDSIDKADSASISYIIYKKDLKQAANNKTFVVNAPTTDQVIWGGIYIVPQQTAVGQLTFRLSGVLLEKDHKWNIVIPVAENRTEKTEEIRGDGSGDELTPVQADKVVGKTDKTKKKNKK